jgi:hypothetical protein
MKLLHNLNVTVHVLCGTIGLLIGLLALLYRNRPQSHIRFGRYFLYTLTIVVGTAFIGILFFHSNSFLLLLTLLGGYVGYSGFRTIRLREHPASTIDLLISIGVLIAGGVYLGTMELAGGNWSPSVVYPTLSALVLVAGYDLIKRLWLFNKLKTWWLYEHIYKMISAYSAILSAFSGTVFPQYKPYSQILPSALCISAIIYFIWQQAKYRKSVSIPSNGLGISEPKRSYSS